MDIILIRHGESTANIDKVYGGKEISLTKKGIDQGIKTKNKISSFKNKDILVSPYKRAIETMRCLGLEGKIEKDLEEVNFGIGIGRTYGELLNEFPKEVKLWNENPFKYRLPKGESLIEAYERVSKLLDRLINRNEDVILICHDGVIRLGLCYVFDNVEYFYRFKLDNLSFTKITIHDGYKYINYQNRIYY